MISVSKLERIIESLIWIRRASNLERMIVIRSVSKSRENGRIFDSD